MADEILPEGIRFFNKKETQPDFVIGELIITLNDLFAFCKEHPELVTDYQGNKQLKLQILKSQKGNLYAKVNTWKPEVQAAPKQSPVEVILPTLGDLPF